MKTKLYLNSLLVIVCMVSPLLYGQIRVLHHSQGAPYYTEEGFWRYGETIGFNDEILRYTYPLMEDDEGKMVPNEARASFNFDIESPGTYEIDVYFIRGDNRAPWVTYEIETLTGRKYTVLDQTGSGGGWHSLGQYSFGKDSYSVSINAATSEGGDVVISDALRIIPVDSNPPARLELISYPNEIVKGEPFSVVTEYETNIYQTRDRGRFIIDVYDTSTGQLIHTEVDNNEYRGYQGPSGGVNTEIVLNQDVKKTGFAVYFVLSDMNEYFIDYMESLPRDGTHPYRWRGGSGVTQTISYRDTVIVENTETDPNTAFCCGLTYQAFMKGMKSFNRKHNIETIFALSESEMRDFFNLWYVSRHADGYWYGAGDALWKYQGGYPITSMHELKKGDFVQIWRRNGSGHSVIFDSWRLDEAGQPVEMRYWSTQGSTDGINFNVEKVADMNLNPIVDNNKLTTFIRVEKPFVPQDRDDPLAKTATFELK